MRKHTILALALLVVLPGCHGRGPVGDEADAVYVAAYGYLIQYRTHFFTVAVDQVCLDGPDARRMAWRMRRSYIRVRADCPDGTPGFVPADWGRDSVPVMRLARGDSAPRWFNFFMNDPNRHWISSGNGTRRESYAAMLWRRLRARPYEVEVMTQYADAGVRSADFDCVLYRTPRGWAIEECGLVDVKWRGHQPVTENDVRGCWHLAWQPFHEEDTAGLPETAYFSTEVDTVASGRGFSTEKEYRVTTAPGLPDTAADRSALAEGWGLGWRWRLDEDHLLHLLAGGGFEGVDVTMVRGPENGLLRGVAVHWDDVGRPSLTDPMWEVLGAKVPCRLAAKQEDLDRAKEIR
ncbi:MAG: hypothetical protein P8174_08055 [Gemmatimonadota bacterium]